MATLEEYFDKDFRHTLSDRTARTVRAADGTVLAEVVVRVHLDFDANVKYVSYYIPESSRTLDVCALLLRYGSKAVEMATDRMQVHSGYVGEDRVVSDDLRFSGRVFLYVENDLTPAERSQLDRLATTLDLNVRVRSNEMARERSRIEKPLAFISHDSRNKDDIARPLAIKLSSMLCPVWFDEFSLRIGASLRESIERGIRETRKCVLILTPEYISNSGWTKTEFSSVFTRELVNWEKVVLPVWDRVSPKEVYEYSPSLADRFALHWSLGVDEVARRLYREILEPA